MSFKKTGVYLLLFLVLAGLYYRYEIQRRAEQAKAEKAAKEALRVFPFPADAVQRLRILDADAAAPVQVVREGEEWKLVEPIEAQADQEEMAKILEALGEVKVRRVVAENPPDLDSFGLEHPQLEVEVGLVDGRTFSLLFGDKTPTGMAFYAKTKEAPRVFLVALGFRYRLGKGVDVLQAKQKKEEETSPTREGRVWPYRRYHAHDAVSRWAG